MRHRFVITLYSTEVGTFSHHHFDVSVGSDEFSRKQAEKIIERHARDRFRELMEKSDGKEVQAGKASWRSDCQGEESR